jgi:hypothetical protein
MSRTYFQEYLGDGLYVEFDGYQTRLWAERGRMTHEVFLEPLVLARFVTWASKLGDRIDAERRRLAIADPEFVEADAK